MLGNCEQTYHRLQMNVNTAFPVNGYKKQFDTILFMDKNSFDNMLFMNIKTVLKLFVVCLFIIFLLATMIFFLLCIETRSCRVGTRLFMVFIVQYLEQIFSIEKCWFRLAYTESADPQRICSDWEKLTNQTLTKLNSCSR